jgi:hypothetical protein
LTAQLYRPGTASPGPAIAVEHDRHDNRDLRAIASWRTSSQPRLLGPWQRNHADARALTIAFGRRALRCLRESSKHRPFLSRKTKVDRRGCVTPEAITLVRLPLRRRGSHAACGECVTPVGRRREPPGPTGTEMLTSAFAESTRARRSAAAAYPGSDGGRLLAVDRKRPDEGAREGKAVAQGRQGSIVADECLVAIALARRQSA